ncbi:MAG: hypothetical protein P1U41_04140 [Vicingaceae bacterium]|nr:hypothetical protein [Vicingaceae bacterium]
MRKNKAFIIFIIVVTISASAFSQSTTNSPYSKYGIGIIRPQTFSQNFAMAGTAIGIRSNKDIGFLNPASYSAIAVTTFDVGFTNNALWLDDGTQSQYQNNPHITHIAFGFPVVKNTWGMSFGVMPYANTGYEYDEIIDDPNAGLVSFYNKGDGAINKVYWGNGFAVNIDSTSNVSVGFNGYFLFGSINHDQKAIYGDLPGGFNLWKYREFVAADFGADLGLQYQKTFSNSENEKIKLTLGATYGLSADVSGTNTELTRTFTGNIDFGSVKDTVEYIDDVEGVIQLPSELGFGFSLEKNKKWLIAADFKSADWGSVISTDPLYSYQSNYKIAIGGQIIPRFDGSKYIERIAYRFGARYSTPYLTINNTDFTEYGITFGVGMPIRRNESTYPRLNLGIEYGSRGTTDNGLIKENFINFNVGITINAVWFQKRKYD